MAHDPDLRSSGERRTFLVLGGGTAGWMAALLLQRAFPEWQVQLLESSRIGTIGVGEGSTPALRSFMDAIGIAEHEWMPECAATYKSGIEFEGWSGRSGYDSYFHPFLTQFDRDHIKALEFNSRLRRAGRDAHAHGDIFAYSHYLAERKLCPIPPWHFPFEVQYGYHFNAGRLAALFKRVALERGVQWRDAEVASVECEPGSGVGGLRLTDGERLTADFYVDCSGFASVMTRKAQDVGFVSYADALFNNSAVTISTHADDLAETRTRSTALRCGWVWRIPQQDRTGHGYVYSSRYCPAEQAEAELRAHLGLQPGEGEARHLKFASGRVESSWNGNVLAVGLSQGFLEPLEATALALVQLTLVRFARYFRAGGFTAQHAGQLNREINEAFDGVKDYIHTHFLVSGRDDTEYWRDCRANHGAASPRLMRVLRCWRENGELSAVLRETGLDQQYKLNSWLYILSGMGLFPIPEKLAPPDPADAARVPLEEIADMFRRCTLNHRSQAEALELLEKGEPVEREESVAGTPEALSRLLGLGFAASA